MSKAKTRKSKVETGLLKRLDKFMSKLSSLELMNFKTLLELKTLPDLLVKMPEGEYKEMVKVAVALKMVLMDSQEKLDATL